MLFRACSAGKTGSHYDPNCDLFQPSEKNMVLTSDAFMLGMLGVLAACTAKLGIGAMFNLYFMPCENETWIHAYVCMHSSVGAMDGIIAPGGPVVLL